jgi:hypothetical protein
VKRWQVSLYACDGTHCGVFSKHWLRRAAARRARIEAADDRRLSQLIGSRWVVERTGASGAD